MSAPPLVAVPLDSLAVVPSLGITGERPVTMIAEQQIQPLPVGERSLSIV